MMAVHKGVGHYGAPITLDQAKKVMAAAEAKARQNDWNVVISIVDSGGHAVMLQRLDDSHLAAIGIAEGKAAPRSSFAGRPRRPARAQSVRARAQEVHRSSSRREVHSPLNSTRFVNGLCCRDHADRPALALAEQPGNYGAGAA
jgi:hypothetical protein